VSLVDTYRSSARRETAKGTKLQGDIAGYQRDKARKQGELGRTNQASRAQTLTRDIQRLDEKVAGAQKDLAAALKKAAEYNEKVTKGELKLQEDAEKARKKLLLEQQWAQKQMQRSIDGTSTQVVSLDSRLSQVEHALLDQVHDAVINDPVDRDFDVFLSHTHPDNEIADEFYRELKARGLEVWFDGAEIILGQSLARQIDRGIAKSKVAIILVTKALIKGRFWTETEMGAFFASRKRVIPVLDGVGRTELSAYSPILADMAGLDTKEEGFDLLAERIVQTLSIEEPLPTGSSPFGSG